MNAICKRLALILLLLGPTSSARALPGDPISKFADGLAEQLKDAEQKGAFYGSCRLVREHGETFYEYFVVPRGQFMGVMDGIYVETMIDDDGTYVLTAEGLFRIRNGDIDLDEGTGGLYVQEEMRRISLPLLKSPMTFVFSVKDVFKHHPTKPCKLLPERDLPEDRR